MIRSMASFVFVCAVSISAFAADPKKEAVKDAVALKDHFNVKKDKNWHGGSEENHLAELKNAELKSEGISFDVVDGAMQLGSSMQPNKPEKIEKIKVGRKAGNLHFLQASGHSAPQNTLVGKYVVIYADKSTVDIEIIYGKHIHDWWCSETDEPSESTVAWTGGNPNAKQNDKILKVFHMSWKNPSPEKEIATIDFCTVDVKQPCAPFCLAITAESVKEKEKEKEKK